MKIQREQITTGSDITKNVEGGGGFRPPALLGLSYQISIKSGVHFCVGKTIYWAGNLGQV